MPSIFDLMVAVADARLPRPAPRRATTNPDHGAPRTTTPARAAR